jgi:hypothetical protein
MVAVDAERFSEGPEKEMSNLFVATEDSVPYYAAELADVVGVLVKTATIAAIAAATFAATGTRAAATTAVEATTATTGGGVSRRSGGAISVLQIDLLFLAHKLGV